MSAVVESLECRSVVAIDKYGRVLVVSSDGCTGKCVTDWKAKSTARRGHILRQTTGRGLLEDYDALLG